MPHSRTASVRSPAPHPSTRAYIRRDRKLAAIVDAEEKAKGDPTTHEDLREMMARRMALMADLWRGCPERLCRRHRYCVHPRAKCTRHPEPDPTPLSEESREMYDRIWAQMLAERRLGRTAELRQSPDELDCAEHDRAPGDDIAAAAARRAIGEGGN